MQWQPPIVRLLDQLTGILTQLSPAEFVTPVDVLSGATIGQHFRHIIECWAELEKGYHTGSVNYDLRQRNRQLESDPKLAFHQLTLLKNSLAQPDRPLILHAVIDDGIDISLPSSYYRELLHNLDHTVHHMAMIRAGLSTGSYTQLPENFGVAYSTQKFRRKVIH